MNDHDGNWGDSCAAPPADPAPSSPFPSPPPNPKPTEEMVKINRSPVSIGSDTKMFDDIIFSRCSSIASKTLLSAVIWVYDIPDLIKTCVDAGTHMSEIEWDLMIIYV